MGLSLRPNPRLQYAGALSGSPAPDMLFLRSAT